MILVLLALAALARPSAPADEPAHVIGARVTTLDGRVLQLGLEDGTRPVALVFLDTECPVSNRYVPRLGELAAAAREAGVEFYGVYSDPTLTATLAREHVAEYELEFPTLFDATGELAARLAPERVPEAFVVGARDELLYRGRIDDRFASVGRVKANITSHDLLDALRAARAGEVRERTEVVGCVYEAWDAHELTGTVTYARDVAPILRAQCIECHRPGDIGPFPLTTYDDARRRARMLAEVTGERIMPPWHAAPGAGRFVDERGLSAREIAVLAAWAEAGAPEGDARDLLPAPKLSDTRWRMGAPDLVIELPVAYPVPAAGDDIYRFFVIPSTLTEDAAIVGVDFRPGDPSVVHHCLAYVDMTGKYRRLDEQDDEPGFSVFGNSIEDSGVESVAGWAPGAQPYRFPAGVAQRLPAGGDFVLEVHYHLSGKATTDRSALALYFADGPVERWAETLVIGTERIDIAPGDGDYGRHVWMELPDDLELIDVSPHMHYLGQEVRVVATRPDGAQEPLIHIPRWDFRWQGNYVYREPLRLPRGTRLDAYFRFDNSAANPFNPSSPPVRVREGWRTIDEMCLFYFTVVPQGNAPKRKLYRAMYAAFGRDPTWER
jgi:hypothetical protein